MNLSSAMSIFMLGDLLWADFWHRFPNLRFALTEGDIGWSRTSSSEARPSTRTTPGWVTRSRRGFAGRAVPGANPVLLIEDRSG